MIVGTTPTITLRLKEKPGLDLTAAEHIYFTIRQGSIKITKKDSDISVINERTVAITLTQPETLQFRYNTEAKIQLNWTYGNGIRAATRVKNIILHENLIREEIE